jgi:hypothetical protein
MAMSRTRRGKIAKLPADLRMEVNRRLHDGQPGGQILPWLNNHARVRPILEAQFQGQAVNDQNLTEWRQGGYLDWLEERERLDALKELSLFAGDAVKAGGSLADGAAAVAAGRLISAIEGSDDDQLLKISSAIASLRGGDAEVKRVKLLEERVKQSGRKLAFDETRWRMRTVELVMEHLKDAETLRIVSQAGLDNDAKTQLLGKRLFGEDW